MVAQCQGVVCVISDGSPCCLIRHMGTQRTQLLTRQLLLWLLTLHAMAPPVPCVHGHNTLHSLLAIPTPIHSLTSTLKVHTRKGCVCAVLLLCSVTSVRASFPSATLLPCWPCIRNRGRKLPKAAAALTLLVAARAALV